MGQGTPRFLNLLNLHNLILPFKFHLSFGAKKGERKLSWGQGAGSKDEVQPTTKSKIYEENAVRKDRGD